MVDRMVGKAVMVLTTDDAVATRLRAAVCAAGGTSVIVEDAANFTTGMDHYFPVLALVDLATTTDWQRAIERCKLRPHTKQIPLLALDRRNDQEAQAAAKQAGADRVWRWQDLAAQLEEVIGAQINPDTIYPAGWDDALSDLARLGVAEFNRGDYFEQHEYLEAAWMAEERPIRALYQGILQVGLAFLQIERGNWQGALKMFRRGLPKLRALPARCQGIDLATFRAAAEAIHREVSELGPERLAEFDQHKFPQICTSQASVALTQNSQRRQDP